MIQVGEFIGLHLADKTLWVLEKDLEILLKGKPNTIANNEKVIVVEKNYVDNRELLVDETCPLSADYSSGSLELQNSSNNRRINVNFFYDRLAIPLVSNPFTLRVEYSFSVVAESRRMRFGIWFFYRTDHYSTMDIAECLYENGASLSISCAISYKAATSFATRSSAIFSNVQYSLIFDILDDITDPEYRIEQSNPGNSTSPFGTGASHRGMGGEYIRLDCD